MKKKILTFALVLLLVLSLCAPVMAVSEYGVIYDETDALGSQSLTYQGEEMLPALIRTVGIDIRVDVLVDSEYGSVDEAATNIYTKYGYGYGDENKGLSLTIQLEDLGNGAYAMESEDEWGVYVYLGDDYEGSLELATAVNNAVGPYMALQAWNGEDMTMSATALSQAVQAMAAAISSCAGTQVPETEDDGEDNTMRYVFDVADMLSYDQWRELEDRAAEISETHNCGVYFAFVEDYTETGADDIYEAAYSAYHSSKLGMGEDRDGIIVVLSMKERDYAMFVYGEYGEYAFSEYGCEQLEGEFLSYFGNDDWYGGVSAYLEACDEYLTLADEGKPVRANAMWGICLGVVLSFMVSGAVCTKLKKKMVNVQEKTEANAYVTAGGLALTEQSDIYTHTTETRTKKEKSSSGGSVSRSGGGGHGRSGKF